MSECMGQFAKMSQGGPAQTHPPRQMSKKCLGETLPPRKCQKNVWAKTCPHENVKKMSGRNLREKEMSTKCLGSTLSTQKCQKNVWAGCRRGLWLPSLASQLGFPVELPAPSRLRVWLPSLASQLGFPPWLPSGASGAVEVISLAALVVTEPCKTLCFCNIGSQSCVKHNVFATLAYRAV